MDLKLINNMNFCFEDLFKISPQSNEFSSTEPFELHKLQSYNLYVHEASHIIIYEEEQILCHLLFFSRAPKTGGLFQPIHIRWG